METASGGHGSVRHLGVRVRHAILALDRAIFVAEEGRLDRFGWVLAATVATIVLQSLVDFREDVADPQQIFATVLVGGTLLLALRAAGVRRSVRAVVSAVVVAGVVAALVVLAGDALIDRDVSDGVEVVAAPAWMIMATLAPVAVIRRLAQHRTIGVGTLLGAVSAYLLIAVAYCFIYLYADSVSAEPIFGRDVPTTTVMYFSLVTITTVGYGQVAPTTNVGGLLATSEAVIGQIYLVTFVAMLVGLVVAGRQGSVASQG